MKPLVLVIDDEEAIRSSLRMILEYEGYRFAGAGAGREGLEAAASLRPDLVLLDIKMPRMDGLEVLAKLREEHPALPVVMISGHGTITTAVEAIRAGAFDFMEKPLERDVVLHRVVRAIESQALRREVRDLRLKYEERFRIVGDSAALDTVREAIARAAPVRSSVLICGESGTGKELVARAIHRNSPRQGRPFVRVNCAAIPEDLIESELFGHEKGSFTGALRDQAGKFVQADGGTVFLDEVADMSLKTQAKVLRVLQDGEVEPVGAAKSFTVDVRVIAATNKDLPAEIRRGSFREDLYYRLNVVPMVIPPLRKRREEIPGLLTHFASDFCRENNYRPRVFSRSAVAALQERPWRGNVRELKNAVERLIIMTDVETVAAGDVERILPADEQGAGGPAAELAAAHEGTAGRAPAASGAVGSQGGSGGAFLPDAAGTPARDAAGTPAPHGAAAADETIAGVGKSSTLQQFKDAAERVFIVERLRGNDWNITATARAIDTPRSNLYKKLEQYGISREKDG